jgi:glycosyltransferase involved in cell wall biosynthesis
VGLAGLSQRVDSQPLETHLHDAVGELSAVVGFRIGGAGGPVCCKQRKRAAADLENLPARIARGPAPVSVESFYWRPAEDYYLVVSELVPYKRVDAAVRAFNQNGRKLRVVGDGPEYKALKRAAAPNIEFCGRVTDEDLRDLYARCRAFLMPGEEDFGIAMVEALASGKPVIALAKGGALEIVPDFGGLLYDEPAGLLHAIDRWDDLEPEVDPGALQAYAAQFSEAEFAKQMKPILFETNSYERAFRRASHSMTAPKISIEMPQ